MKIESPALDELDSLYVRARVHRQVGVAFALHLAMRARTHGLEAVAYPISHAVDLLVAEELASIAPVGGWPVPPGSIRPGEGVLGFQ